MTRVTTLGLCLATTIVAAGCGSVSKSTSSGSPASAPVTSTASTAAPSTAAGSAAGAQGALVTTKRSKLGTILAAGQKRLTVYLYEADTGSSSRCTGACAKLWPPLTSAGAPRAGLQARAADLATTTRSDGSRQVTYRGHPLYLYAKDKDDGDAYGQGLNSFAAAWYVLAPSGKKVDKS